MVVEEKLKKVADLMLSQHQARAAEKKKLE
jgi:hypothetical protein